ncbi:uncharacterized protein LOC143816266 isoform X2 [Ranitomeya variabilis]|uniref:uncharacterized protein LOC143769029 isoform X1 n=1 Tax=Ranitomeya variabilis TaxID=490064 RepID=UPI0040573FDD
MSGCVLCYPKNNPPFRRRPLITQPPQAKIQWSYGDQGPACCTTRGTAASTVPVDTNTTAPPAVVDTLQRDVRAKHLHGITPVNVTAMGPWLSLYPNKEAAQQLDLGFKFGFFIPFNFSRETKSANNLKSAREFPEILRKKVQKEVELGRMAGPFTSMPFSNFRISPLGIVPKKEPGKYRLIHHLSYPKGDSVNDAILPEEASVTYASFDRAVELVRAAGPGALLAKSDIESAFRLLPVHPECFHLLGCKVDQLFYFDMCLPMGCSISCHYFELFSTFLDWVVRYETGSNSTVHYLDDFLFVGPKDSELCYYLLNKFEFIASHFGVPLSTEKTVGPCNVLPFLGIEIDTNAMVFRLPEDKLLKTLKMVEDFCGVKKVTLQQMQSLLGLLNFACRVMPVGRTFSRRLSLATKGISQPGHRIRLTRTLKEDLLVWRTFLYSYNGHTCLMSRETPSKELGLAAGGSLRDGFVAIYQNQWCKASWPASWASANWGRDPALLEVFAIVAAVELWGTQLENRNIRFSTKHPGTAKSLNSMSSASPPLLALLRRLALLCLKHNIWCRATVTSVDNNLVNALLFSDWQAFKALLPTAQPSGVQCPTLLLDTVANQ